MIHGILALLALASAPALFFLTSSRSRAFLYSVTIFWISLIASAQYHIAFTPGYDSFAPALTIVSGWIPALLYASLWLAIVSGIRHFNSKRGTITPQTQNVTADERAEQLVLLRKALLNLVRTLADYGKWTISKTNLENSIEWLDALVRDGFTQSDMNELSTNICRYCDVRSFVDSNDLTQPNAQAVYDAMSHAQELAYNLRAVGTR
jgi:hypothetical protein